MKKIKSITLTWIILCAMAALLLSGCGASADNGGDTSSAVEESSGVIDDDGEDDGAAAEDNADDDAVISAEELPEYSGTYVIEINGNEPYFTEDDYTTESFEEYSDLDALGRCGTAYANIGQDLMPTEERGSIGSVKPSGWHTVKYDIVDGNYLYNRCHLIGYQLSGENANEKNLITGTRWLNVEEMLPYENLVADYVEETDNHVLYRVTPIFEEDNLVASGVLMEGWSVEDEGDGVCFCVYAYNVQPGVEIDYETGDSSLEEDGDTSSASSAGGDASGGSSSGSSSSDAGSEKQEYVLNTNTKKFHDPSCSSVGQMSESNKETVKTTREDLISQGYDPCGSCNP